MDRNQLTYSIRLAEPQELPQLPEIERRAGQRFAAIDALRGMPEDVSPMAELEQAWKAGRVWVAVLASGSIVGFAYAAVIDGFCHLEELDVLPEHGRRGLGAALVDVVRRHAGEAGLDGVTLTTFRDVPWNAPFYRRLGFRTLDPQTLPPGLAAAFADEARRGLPTELRVVMFSNASG
ncbi:MAG: GNAT family N-acetyltransferase [Acidobacteriota bacterium]